MKRISRLLMFIMLFSAVISSGLVINAQEAQALPWWMTKEGIERMTEAAKAEAERRKSIPFNGLKFTAYHAFRYLKIYRIGGMMIHPNTELSNHAYKTFDRSTVLKEPTIYKGIDGELKLTKYWYDITGEKESQFKLYNPFITYEDPLYLYKELVWGEFTGFVKLPAGEYPLYCKINDATRLIVEIDGQRVMDLWEEIPKYGGDFSRDSENFYTLSPERIPFKIQVEPGKEYRHIRILIGNAKYRNFATGSMVEIDGPGTIGYFNPEPEPVKKGSSMIPNGYRYVPFSADSLYTTIPVTDLANYVIVDDDHDIINLHPGLHLSQYQYGIAHQKGNVLTMPQTYHDFTSYSQPVGDITGRLIIKNRTDKGNLLVGKFDAGEFTNNPSTPSDLTIKYRTAAKTVLQWKPSTDKIGIKEYEIYRSSNNNTTMSFGDGMRKIGTSSATTFTDDSLAKHLLRQPIYEYYVKAVDNDGNISAESNRVKTDDVPLMDIPTPPENLRLSSINIGEVNLEWDISYDNEGIKEYVIYRENTLRRDPITGSECVIIDLNPEDNIIGRVAGDDIKEYVVPAEHTVRTDPKTGLSSVILDMRSVEELTAWGAEFKDTNVEMAWTYNYSVIAVDTEGNPSPPSNILTVRALQPPTVPTGLKAGSIYREELKPPPGSIQQIFLYEVPIPESWVNYVPLPGYQAGDMLAAYDVFLGPDREVYLKWKESSDDLKVIGYDIYRKGGSRYFSEPLHKVGTTTDTHFIDSGLHPDGHYMYMVVARDEDGCESPSSPDCPDCTVFLHTICYYLQDITLSDGELDSPFIYHRNNYSAEVDYTVKSITVNPQRVDPESTVLVNGKKVRPGDVSNPIELEIGANTINIDVSSRSAPHTPERRLRYTVTVNRKNMDNPPALTLPQGETVINEGDIYKGSGSVDITEGAWQGTVDYGDGSGIQKLTLNSDNTFALEHLYKNDGEYIARVTFTCQDVGETTGTVKIKVNNLAPILTVSGMVDEIEAKEGVQVSLEGKVIDPGDDQLTLTVDYGDVLGPRTTPLNTDNLTVYEDSLSPRIKLFNSDNEELTLTADNTFTLKKTYYELKPHIITVKATDDKGAFSIKRIKVNVKNIPPVVEIHDSTEIVQRGVIFERSGRISDIGSIRNASVDYGDGYGEQVLSLNSDKTFNLKHVYLISGTYTVTVRVEDNGGGVGTASFPLKVKDYIFKLEAGEDIFSQEGQRVNRDVKMIGPVNKIQNIMVDYGDETAEQDLKLDIVFEIAEIAIDYVPISTHSQPVVAQSPTQGTAVLNHTFKDNGSYNVVVKLTDVDDDVYEETFQVEVENVSPVVELEKDNSTREGEGVSITGSFSDPGEDTWTATANYGDGSEQKVTLKADKTFKLWHTYRTFGDYTVTVKVKDDDGGVGVNTTKVWIRPRGGSSSSNVRLSNIVVSSGTLIPEFSSSITSYTVTVDGSVSSIDVTATLEDSSSSMTINDTPQVSETPRTVELEEGANLITIEVTGENDSTQTYFVTVNRGGVPLFSNAELSNLAVSPGELTPGFESNKTSYTVNVTSDVENIEVTATLADSKASMNINGVSQTSGSPMFIELDEGETLITIQITAENGVTTKKYKIRVLKEEPNALLESITFSNEAYRLEQVDASFPEGFKPECTKYFLWREGGNSYVTVTAQDDDATIKVIATSLDAGDRTYNFGNMGTFELLEESCEEVTITVTASDGSTTKTYTLQS